MFLKVATVFIASAKVSASTSLRVRPDFLKDGCADVLAREDCEEQKNFDVGVPNGLCYVYAQECAGTCGCDFDQDAVREQAGLDDAYYNSDEFQCVDGDEFEDGFHFNCTLYEGANWCQVDAEGDTVEGPGWCDWFNPAEDACNVNRADRWVRHPGFANKDGRWAKSCCCNSGLAETYPYEGEGEGNGEGVGECIDRLDSQGRRWTDQFGYSCRAYHFGSFCTLDGQIGPGWDVESYGSNLRSYTHEGLNPLSACCTCGGADFGGTGPTEPTPPPTSYSPTSDIPTSYSPSTSPPTTFVPTTYTPTTSTPTTFVPTTYIPTDEDEVSIAAMK